ncbi:MAG TPA: peptidyl-prolyl cis-trans isomerase [Candidatus Sulfotelmatobacter sp.]|nr:peptidyl-prolyl cis-trans isomerase [Candidatus Sulfotelmatobacter sp.]
MKLQLMIGSAVMAAALSGNTQVVASHAPSLAAPAAATQTLPTASTAGILPPTSGNPVAKVNGAILTERDLWLEMQAIFPYAQTHNGIPKSMEPEMRKGALQMIIFEELLYQQALREKRTVPEERLKKAEAEFHKQFASEQEYNDVMQKEVHGSKQLMRERIRRSLLIEQMLTTEVRNRSKVSEAAALAYYKANPGKFQRPETFSIQTISIIPPQNLTPDMAQEARKKAENALKQGKATKTYQEFGLLAEKVSEDDWHVNMGDRKAVDRDKLPPPVVKAALAMKPGQVSDLIQLGPAYTLFRLNAHTPAGITPFSEVKAKLMMDLQKQKTEQLRSALDQKLRKNAKIEVL